MNSFTSLDSAKILIMQTKRQLKLSSLAWSQPFRFPNYKQVHDDVVKAMEENMATDNELYAYFSGESKGGESTT